MLVVADSQLNIFSQHQHFLLFLFKYDEKYGIDSIEGGEHFSEIVESAYDWPKSVAKASIHIENVSLSVFFDKWVKVRQQYLDGIIDADIYDLWLQRELGQSWTLEKMPKSNIKNKYELPFQFLTKGDQYAGISG